MAGLAGGGAESDDFLAELVHWSARERVARAASERSKARSLQEQSAAEATWAGVLLDLAEDRAEVTVSMSAGFAVSGRLVGVGRDFVVVQSRRSTPVLVTTAAIASLAPGSASAAPERPGGGRRPPLELSLAGALDALAGERAPVLVRSGSSPVTGSLVACGQDVVTIRADGSRKPVYVPLGAVACVELR